jgi:hypothetical protein
VDRPDVDQSAGTSAVEPHRPASATATCGSTSISPGSTRGRPRDSQVSPSSSSRTSSSSWS